MGHEIEIRKHITKDAEGVGNPWNALEVWNDNFDKIRQIVDGMDPRQLRNGGRVYGELAQDMNGAANLLYNQGIRMAEAWSGKDAEKAKEAVDKTHRQMQEIVKVSDQTSKAMMGHAEQQDDWKRTYGSGSRMDTWVSEAVKWGRSVLAVNPVTGPSAVHGLIANNAGAANAMGNINDGTEQSNNNFPPGIRQDMPITNVSGRRPDAPGLGGGPGSPTMPGGGAPPGGGLGDVPGGPGQIPDGPGGPGHIPGGPGDTPGGPGGVPGGGTDLASLPGSGPGLGGGGLGGGPGGAPSLGAGGMGGGSGVLGASPGGLGVGPGNRIGGPGEQGSRVGAGKGGMSGMGMPMGAGAGGRSGDGNEHERSTWLSEDKDVWGGDDDAAPPVIG
ncbi:hypothetical protein E1264_39440 [Actinomadura sp. KC216]|uniref:WXG100 family type VII secretion target n=1 Tax=Actinomadura sp. KC216 TaxID=2530370 RepID=UPI00104A7E5A|nr:hypothetical protein [Actinomadura sp. KC216]TDB75716.1 hypothetical protein E1264_39440 [Actinomadura sp. KC216]